MNPNEKTHAIGDGSLHRRRKYNPDLANQLNREAELAKLKRKSKPEETEEVREEEQPDAKIETIEDFWRVSGVNYRNGIYVVDLAKTLLDSGNIRTQDDWAKHYESAVGRNEFHTPDYPILYGLVKALCTGRNNAAKKLEIAEAQKFLKDNAQAHWLMTLTRVRYQPRGKDTIIYNYGTRDKYEEQTDFVGPDEAIKGTAKPLACQKLLGTSDSVQTINDVFKWLNKTDAYIWRLNQKPKQVDERVARLVANSDRANLNCYGYPLDAGASLGVRFVRAQKILGV